LSLIGNGIFWPLAFQLSGIDTSLCDIYLDKYEKDLCIYKTTVKSYIYAHYLDYICMVWPKDEKAYNRLFGYIEKTPTLIRFKATIF